MEFHFSVTIDRSMNDVFTFLEDMSNHPQERGTKVLLVEKTTSGPIGVGTRFREVVAMLPLTRVEMASEVTKYKQHSHLEFTWHGGGMEGVLSFSLKAQGGATSVTLHEVVTPKGLMKLVGPVIRASFQRNLGNRLQGIKRVLERQS
ncbi:MAG: hypothetical protein GTO14_13765 [Anaerolineales bacterium]|nr:hypothetical protein [Anaerolineales bacterium]